MDPQDVSRIVLYSRRRRQAALVFLILISLYHDLMPSPPFQVLAHRSLGRYFITTLENADHGVWESLFRIRKECFNTLCNWLAANTELPQYSEADITLREKAMMFLWQTCNDDLRRRYGFVFRRVIETVYWLTA